MKTDNRSSGTRFEQAFAAILSVNGFWAHVMQQNKAGQPADIVAIRGKFRTLIDCKEISDLSDGFPFKRVEENQRLAMEKFFKVAHELCYFALKLPVPDGEDPLSNIRMISYSRIKSIESGGSKSLTPKMLMEDTWSLETWLEASRTWAED